MTADWEVGMEVRAVDKVELGDWEEVGGVGIVEKGAEKVAKVGKAGA